MKRKLALSSLATICATVALLVLAACGPKSIKINFISDCEQIASVELADGKVTPPAEPSRPGYFFDGWYFDDGIWSDKLDPENLADKKFEKDVNVYAKWELITYSVVYENTDGAENPNPLTYTVESEEITLLPLADKEYSRFVGWFDAAIDGNLVASLAKGSTGDITLYARWETNAYIVSFDTNGNGSVSPQRVSAGFTADNPGALYFDDIILTGWYTDRACTQAFDFSTPITADVTLYAGFGAAADYFDFQILDQDLAEYNLLDRWGGWILSGKEGVDYPDNLYFPKSYQDKSIMYISGFADLENLVSVGVPQGIYYLDGNLFAGCTNLATAEFPDSLEYIGNGILYNTAWRAAQPDGILYADCAAIGYKGTMPDHASLSFREGTRVIAERLFWLNHKVEKIHLPASLYKIGFNAFLQCPLNEITVDPANEQYAAVDNVLYSKDGATLVLYGIGKADTTFTVPETVTAIGDEAFAFAPNLTEIIINDNVSTVGDGVFDGVENLVSITFGRGITRVGDGVLHEDRKLVEVIVLAPEPFQFGVYFLPNNGNSNYTLKIPAEYLEAYKNHSRWGTAKNNMVAL